MSATSGPPTAAPGVGGSATGAVLVGPGAMPGAAAGDGTGGNPPSSGLGAGVIHPSGGTPPLSWWWGRLRRGSSSPPPPVLAEL